MFFFLILFVPPSGVVLRGKTLHYLSLYLLLVCSLFLRCCLSLLALWLFVAEAHSGDKLNPCLSIFLQQRNTSCLKAFLVSLKGKVCKPSLPCVFRGHARPLCHLKWLDESHPCCCDTWLLQWYQQYVCIKAIMLNSERWGCCVCLFLFLVFLHLLAWFLCRCWWKHNKKSTWMQFGFFGVKKLIFTV